MKDLSQILEQAKQMQEKVAEIQAGLDDAEIQGSAGGGMVTVTLSGKGDLRAVKIAPQAVHPNEVDILEDLIVAAFAEAKTRVEKYAAEEMRKLTGGMQLPAGFNLPI